MTQPAQTEDGSAPTETAGGHTETLKLIDRLQEINNSWLDNMMELQGTDAQLGAKLFAAKNAADAMALCNQWMAKRLSIIGAEQQALVKAWIDIVQIIGKSAKVTLPAMGDKAGDDST